MPSVAAWTALRTGRSPRLSQANRWTRRSRALSDAAAAIRRNRSSVNSDRLPAPMNAMRPTRQPLVTGVTSMFVEFAPQLLRMLRAKQRAAGRGIERAQVRRHVVSLENRDRKQSVSMSAGDAALRAIAGKETVEGMRLIIEWITVLPARGANAGMVGSVTALPQCRCQSTGG